MILVSCGIDCSLTYPTPSSFTFTPSFSSNSLATFDDNPFRFGIDKFSSFVIKYITSLFVIVVLAEGSWLITFVPSPIS